MAEKSPIQQQIEDMNRAIGSIPPIPNMINYERPTPEIRFPDFSNMKPTSMITVELLEELNKTTKAEFARVAEELVKANNRAENAEIHAVESEVFAKGISKKSYCLAFIAFIIPFSFSVLQWWQVLQDKTELKELKATVQLLYQRIQTLESEAAIAKTQQRLVVPPSRSTVATPKAKHP